MAFIKLIRPSGPDMATSPMGKIYDQANKRAGYVANIIQIMSQDAKSCSASMGFYIALMKSPNALESVRKEMLATVVSNANDCFY
jgi:alkylhydroperoxidase family enzyme